MIGRNLGRYRITALLGEGGMGRVYGAEDPALGRRVAIKVLAPAYSADSEFRERLVFEARSASALNHPNILTVFDLGEEDGTLWLATELVDGRSLGAWAGERARTPAEILALVRQATGALAVAHAQGLVHRDLKPDNLMVRRDGLLKILDFGLARSVARAEGATMRHTAPGTILGTAPYMSPEQVLGQPAGPPSDVFSIGTILHELLAGRHPFAADSAVETMARILQETPAPPSALVPGLPAALDFVLAKALARDPKRRYPAAGDLDVDLESCETALAAAAPRRPQREAAAAAAQGPRAIAVLPFKQIGGSAEFDYLGIGLADAVITRLSTSPDLVVRATSSIARFEKLPVETQHVARELAVSAVLDASFQRAGSRFRATARLIEEPGGRALWAGKIDVAFDDIFAVQDEVADGIAAALSARLRAVDGARHTPAPEVFALYLRSREPDRTGTREGMLHKIGLVEQALARDAEYADAWAYLGKLQQSMVDAGFDSDPAWYVRAEESCRRALALDPEHSYARYVQGSIDLVRGRKREAWNAFVARHREHPNDFQPLHYMGYVLRLSNRTDDALDIERLACTKDPGTPWAAWSIVRLLAELGRDDEAAAEMERVRIRFADSPLVRGLPLMLLRNQGRFEEVVAQAEGSGEEPRVAFERAYALLRLGRRDEAEAPFRAVHAHAPIDMDFAAYCAALHAWRDERDIAFASLERAAELGNDCVYLLERADLFGPLHDDPRWPACLAAASARAEACGEFLRWPPEPAAS
jgi:TolB-like protein/tetratricopeptide (TPR) repeat protein